MGTADIYVHSRLTIVPKEATKTRAMWPLSYLDHMMKKHTVKAVYYYNTSCVHDKFKLLDRLRESLCKVLSIYPIFAGRIQKRGDGTCEVKCNDAGLRVYEANCTHTLKDFLAECRNDHLLESKLTRMEINESHAITPVATIQLTEFTCGSLAISLSWNHLIGDAVCGTLFMKSWGETFRTAQVMQPPFFHPPSLQPRDKCNLDVRSRDYYTRNFFNSPYDYSSKKFSTITLSFNNDSVEHIKSKIQDGNFKYGPPTPSDAVSALLWISILRAQRRPRSDEARLSLCLEFRKIHLPALPYGYLGNAMHFVGVSQNVGDLLEQDLSYASSLINECRGSVDTEEVRSVIDLIRELEKEENYLRKEPPFFYSAGLTITILDHFPCYDVVFDFGKPMHVVYMIEPFKGEGQVLLLPGPDGKSNRIAMVSLPEDVLINLLKDVELSKFAKQI